MTPGSISAPVIEQTMAYIFPNGVGAIQPNRISGLDFDRPRTAQARNLELGVEFR
jgi:hypothetical protein